MGTMGPGLGGGGEHSRWWQCWTFDGVGNTVDGGDVEDHMGGEGAGGFGGNGGKEGGASEFDMGCTAR